MYRIQDLILGYEFDKKWQKSTKNGKKLTKIDET